MSRTMQTDDRIYLHRLPPEDRDAALALLDETAAARRA